MGKRVGDCGMRFKEKIIILAMSFIILSDGKLLSKQKSFRVNKRIELLNRAAVKTIQSEDGDIIDCIDIYKQPAFDHPALRNHTIQMTPSYDPTIETRTTKEESSRIVTSQVWHRSGSCPEGTIPIRRIRKTELLTVHSPENFARKKPDSPRVPTRTQTTQNTHFERLIHKENSYFQQQINRSKAILLTEGYSYSGAKGDINVWNPHVESDDEYSTAQICLKNGRYDDYESIESGWAVNPSVYGDKRTRLFTYWTVGSWCRRKDASKKTGCFDLTCPGFVQTSSEIALGATIDPISVPFGTQYLITLYIFKDQNTGNWWLRYGNKINIGYWPPDIFCLISHSASSVEWGGEVYSPKIGNPPHTTTAMGSGEFSSGLYGFSSFIREIRIRDNSLFLKYPEWVYAYADEYDCYDAYNMAEYMDEPEFYFGGPGRNPKCP